MAVGFWSRAADLCRVRRYDLVWIEKEIFPFFPAIAEWLVTRLGIPYVVEYDDATFHRYDLHANAAVRILLGRKIDSVMRNASLVIAGNEYLADRASRAGALRIEIVPTVIDLQRYACVSREASEPVVVGWIGSPATSAYLLTIAPAIEALATGPGVRFVAVGASADSVAELPLEVIAWSEETEVSTLQTFDIGVMPLADSPWEKGKCGYKLIQFMACSLPVVASPVGVNEKIIRHGDNGYLWAASLEEWERSLQDLVRDRELRREMGDRGRADVESTYCVQVQVPRLQQMLVDAAGRCAGAQR